MTMVSIMSNDFTLKKYRESLEEAKNNGYTFYTMKDFEKSKGKKLIIFLRHDIDFDITLAENFARIEHKLGICSTYFIRVHAKNYNIFSPENYRILKEIMEMGHEIGLHYEMDFGTLNNEEIEQMIKRDKTILEAVANKKVLGCAAHEPSRKEHFINDGNIKNFGFIYHAYSDFFLKENKYISESSGRWREEDMMSYIKKKTPRLYILTHPLWWFKDSPIENY